MDYAVYDGRACLYALWETNKLDAVAEFRRWLCRQEIGKVFTLKANGVSRFFGQRLDYAIRITPV